MKIKTTLIFVLICSFISINQAQNLRYSIIPEPQILQEHEGFFELTSQTVLIAPKGNTEIIDFNSKIKKSLGFFLLTDSTQQTSSYISITTNHSTLPPEGYILDIEEHRIKIQASTNTGVFYALQTLYQLMPPFIYAEKSGNITECKIPQCHIEDAPRFNYRGSHLDVCRHFITVEQIKRHIEHIALYKINYFHWHLTDDQGWRIEIKKYPKLQSIASQRAETWIGHFTSGLGYDGKPYGGYYTQDEIREVVAFAKRHHVTIIPEIEMPGHSSAAIAAYPELSCTGGPHKVEGTWGVFDDVFCTTEETFTFLQDVIDEVLPLFPNSPYIHIGGDECPKTRWKACAKCQERIRKEGLKDEYELQSYFLNRMAQYIISKGRKVIAWDEALEGGIPDDVIIMSWQGESGGVEAAKQHHEAIMTPSAYLYLNFYQGEPESEPTAIGGYLPLKKVYNYDPISRAFSIEQQKYVIGAQANLWTEYINNWELAEYMLFPRLCALAEVVWSPKSARNYKNFIAKLNHHFNLFDAIGVNYSKSHFNVTATTEWNYTTHCPQVALHTACPDCEIRYTLNGTIPDYNNAQIYTNPIPIRVNTNLQAMAFREGKTYSSIFKENYTIAPSTGKSYVMKNINPQYNGGHDLALTDGVFGGTQSWNKWVGTLANDLEVVIDMDSIIPIQKVSIQFLHAPGSWIFAPTSVVVSISNDNKNWHSEMINNDFEKYKNSETQEIIFKEFDYNKIKARYIKIIATSIKKCPEGHPGAGYDAHLFTGEIVVE